MKDVRGCALASLLVLFCVSVHAIYSYVGLCSRLLHNCALFFFIIAHLEQLCAHWLVLQALNEEWTGRDDTKAKQLDLLKTTAECTHGAMPRATYRQITLVTRAGVFLELAVL